MSSAVGESPGVGVSSDPEQAVHETSLAYVESWYAGDAARMQEVVHPELARRFVRRFPSGVQFLEESGASKLVEWTRAGGGRGNSAEQYRAVTVLDVYFRAAMSKVVTWSGVEYLQLGRFGNSWQVVNVLGEDRRQGPFEMGSAPVVRPEEAQGSADATAEVEAAVRDYAEGWYTADAPRVARVTHPQWSKKGVRVAPTGGCFLESWGADKMTRWVASDEHRRDRAEPGLQRCDVTVLDQHAAVAAARVSWDFDPGQQRPDSVDYFALTRAGGSWRAVNILWERDRSSSDHPLPDARTDWVW
jgi:hypothetical protein